MTRDFLVDVMMYCINREVPAFENAEAVMAYLTANHSIDLLVADVYLPARNGFKLLQFIKKHHPRIFFIAMSANPDDYKPAIDHGADFFLAKPFILQDLFDIVQRFVIGHPASTSVQADCTANKQPILLNKQVSNIPAHN